MYALDVTEAFLASHLEGMGCEANDGSITAALIGEYFVDALQTQTLELEVMEATAGLTLDYGSSLEDTARIDLAVVREGCMGQTLYQSLCAVTDFGIHSKARDEHKIGTKFNSLVDNWDYLRRRASATRDGGDGGKGDGGRDGGGGGGGGSKGNGGGNGFGSPGTGGGKKRGKFGFASP